MLYPKLWFPCHCCELFDITPEVCYCHNVLLELHNWAHCNPRIANLLLDALETLDSDPRNSMLHIKCENELDIKL